MIPIKCALQRRALLICYISLGLAFTSHGHDDEVFAAFYSKVWEELEVTTRLA